MAAAAAAARLLTKYHHGGGADYIHPLHNTSLLKKYLFLRLIAMIFVALKKLLWRMKLVHIKVNIQCGWFLGKSQNAVYNFAHFAIIV